MRPLAGILAVAQLLVVPTVAILTGHFNDEFVKYWGLVSPVASGFAIYFFKTREAEKAPAGNGGAS